MNICPVHGESCEMVCGIAANLESDLLKKRYEKEHKQSEIIDKLYAEAIDLLVDCWFQFSTYTDAKGKTHRSTGGMFDALPTKENRP